MDKVCACYEGVILLPRSAHGAEIIMTSLSALESKEWCWLIGNSSCSSAELELLKIQTCSFLIIHVLDLMVRSALMDNIS